MNLTALCISLALAGLLHPDAASAEAYRWDSVSIGGGGLVAAFVPSTTIRGPAYARTDVGGAYRWDVQAARWAPMMDWVWEEEVFLFGVSWRASALTASCI